MNDIYFMQEAIKEALKARELMEVPIGAIIVKDNKIVGRGYNRKETLKDATLHAEIIAIKDACKNLGGWRLPNCTMYVTLEPCAMCAGALVNARVDRLVIATSDEKTGACGSVLNIAQNQFLNHQINIEYGVCEDECKFILKGFFKDLRKTKDKKSYVEGDKAVKEKIKNIVDNISEEIIKLSNDIYDNPELGDEEYESCKLHVELLKKHGFTVEENYLNEKTGFKAEYKSKKEGPTVAYMAEYDALPGIGHGCGHNMLGATSTGAGITLKNLLDEIGGTVIVFGTPAEETNGAKVSYAQKGAFDKVDVAMVCHPLAVHQRSGTSLAMEAIQFEFFGKTSHAASSPEKGINALDGVINTFNSINAMRQHMRSDARIHGVIVDGGKAANIVPDYAKAQFYVRAKTKKYLLELVERVKNCARGASLATGAKLEISNYELSYDNLVTNQKLSDLYCDKLSQLTDAKIHDQDSSFGSLDAGNVSHICPTIHPYFSITPDKNIVGHTIEFAESTRTPYAYENMKIAIAALAMTGAEVITNKELLKEIKEEFNKAEK